MKGKLSINKVHLMDCLKGIKLMPVPDLILTDPPYEFNAMGGGVHKIGSARVKFQGIIDAKTNHFDFDKYIPPILDLQGDSVNAYFFCNKTLLPNYLGLAVKKGLLYDVLAIRKRNPIPAMNSSHAPELEYCVFLRSKGVYFNSKLPFKYYKKVSDVSIGQENKFHPNQKPVEFLRRLIKVSSKEKDLVFDPFMGSGSTALACTHTNRRYIGFEINEKFLKIANKRLKQSNLMHEVSDWFK